MKLKLSAVELRRLADLLVDSVARGQREDIRLRDTVLNILHDHMARHRLQQQRRRAIKEDAAIAFRATFQRANRKGTG